MTTVTGAFASGRLRRLASAGPHGTPAPGDGGGRERCDLCAEPVQPGHRHLLDVVARELSCACRACAVLFDQRQAGGGHYLLVPERRLRLTGGEIDGALWARTGIPVELAFFVRHGTGEVTAGYPSPLGALRSAVDPQTWQALAADRPALLGMADDVEALLVNRSRGAREQWLVPLDECYRLVAVVRAHWSGFGGGTEVWDRVEAFFQQLSAGPGGPAASEEATAWPRSR